MDDLTKTGITAISIECIPATVMLILHFTVHNDALTVGAGIFSLFIMVFVAYKWIIKWY